MTDLPSEIQVWESYPKLHHTGTWATTRYPAKAVPYVCKADAELAVAQVVEKAAWTAYRICAETRHVKLGSQAEEAILALAPADALAEVQRLREAVEALVVVLDRNDKKGPIPDVEMMFCWLAAQGVRAAFQKIAQKGEAT